MGWGRYEDRNRFAGAYAHQAGFADGGDQKTVRAFAAAMQRAIAPHKQAWRAADASRDPRVRLEAALSIANAAATLMRVPIGRVKIIQGSNAYADERGIFFGAELAATLPVKTLAQILLHEAGHRHAGHTDELSDLLVRLLQESGALSKLDVVRHNHNMEYGADVYAAVGAWLFDRDPVPGIARWLASHQWPSSDSHPDSLSRARVIKAITDALSTILPRGFLT